MAKTTIDELLTRKNPPVVQAGKYDNVVIKSYEKQTVNGNSFIRFTFKLTDGREISDNRFAQGLGIMISHLREQLKLQDVEISGTELFEPNKYKFTIWVEKTTIFNVNTGMNQRVTNIHFLEPLQSIQSKEDSEATTEATTEASEPIKEDELPE